jgi:hypothetical protein
VDQPRLGVQPGGARVVGHPHVDALLHQPVQRFPLRGPGERGRHDAHGHVPAAEFLNRGTQQVQAGPPDEGDDGIDAVGRGELRVQGVRQGRFAGGIGEEVVIQERDVRQPRWLLARQERRVNGLQYLGGGVNAVIAGAGVVVSEPAEQAVGQFDLQLGSLG